MVERVGAVVALELVEGPLPHIARGAGGHALLYQARDAVTGIGDDLVLWELGHAEDGERVVDREREVAGGVEQGAVEVEDRDLLRGRGG